MTALLLVGILPFVAMGILVGSLGEVKVLVAEADFERARAILDANVELLPEDVDQIIYDPEDDDDFDPDEDDFDDSDDDQ